MSDDLSEEKPDEILSRAEESPEAGEAITESDQAVLTPEEQMARFEESLKNDDWGHQPC